MSKIFSNKTKTAIFSPLKVIFLIPVYDDWESLEKLLNALDSEFSDSDWMIEVLVIDDGSQNSFDKAHFTISKLKKIRNVSVVELRRNLGHQRAIALGLTHIEAKIECDVVLIMDGDGEDTPIEAKRLIEKCAAENFTKIIFGRRTKRSESRQFRVFYEIYKFIYKLLTGQDIRFGNFSAVPATGLNRLVIISEIWNHYAAAVSKARIPYAEIDTARGVRLDGKSKMNFVSLVIHGLSAISVYGEIIGIRLLLSTIFMMVVSVVLIAIVVAVRLLTSLAIPGWATYVTSLLVVILLQFITLSLFFSFLVLTGRNNAIFFPQNEYRHFIKDEYEIVG